MTLFGINFACGVATGLILEFEFGTNWSNYSWFCRRHFRRAACHRGHTRLLYGSHLYRRDVLRLEQESAAFHLASSWLTALGVSLSALWILVANSWMQNPVGMRFDPAQMRNVMTDFFAVALSPVAANKFFHAVFSGWTLAGVFVVGASADGCSSPPQHRKNHTPLHEDRFYP